MTTTTLDTAAASFNADTWRGDAARGGAGSRIRRRLMAGLGVLCVALGTIGIFVPGLPTTVFLLAASYLFARSCPAFERRLMAHPRLGAYLRAARGRSMPLRAKIVALCGMWGGICTSVVLMGGPAHVLSIVVMGLGVIGTCAIVFLAGRVRVSSRA